MPNHDLTAENESIGFSSIIPKVYPNNLEDCLKIFEDLKYKCYGFPLVFLAYNYNSKYWDVTFRNPANFNNPDIKAQTPLKAVHEMFDFLKKNY